MQEQVVPFLDVKASYQELQPQLDAAYCRVMEAGWFIGGPEVDAFESAFAARCETAHCVGVSNGLDAIELLIRGAGVGRGDEVLVPAHTFVATWLGVSRAGAIPVPVECDPSTFNIDPHLAAKAVTARTRAIVAVHLYGRPADMGPLQQLAREKGLWLFEDSAQAHGAVYCGQPVGSLGDGAAFSFYPGKNLGAFGDAGCVTTNNSELARQVRLLANYGSRQKYVHEVHGMNARLDTLQAALLGVKLQSLDAWNDRRRVIARRYLAQLSGLPGLELPPSDEVDSSVWHLFVIRHERRDWLQAELARQGVATQIHYPIPPHLSQAYVNEFGECELPVSVRMAREVLSLPIGPHQSIEQTDRVISAMASILEDQNTRCSRVA